MTGVPDVLVYVGPGVVIALVALLGYWLRSRRRGSVVAAEPPPWVRSDVERLPRARSDELGEDEAP